MNTVQAGCGLTPSVNSSAGPRLESRAGAANREEAYVHDHHLKMAADALRLADQAAGYKDDADAARRVSDYALADRRLTKALKADSEAYGILIDLAEAILAPTRVGV